MTKTITLDQKDVEKLISDYVSREWFQGKPVAVNVHIEPGDRPGEPDTIRFSIVGPVD